MRKILWRTGKRLSMRFIVVLTLGTAVLFFVLLFFYIFVNNMFDMLGKSESEQIRARGEIVVSAVNVSMLTARAFTTDWASWDDTYNFAIGKNPDHFTKYWTKDWKIQGQKYNFLVVKDLAGNDLYAKYYDYFKEQSIPAPEGFSRALTFLADDVQKKLKARRDSGIMSPEDSDGFIFHNGVPYYVCARPILTFDEKSSAAGTLFFGRILDEREINRIATATDFSFTVLEASSEEIQDLGSEFVSGGSPIKVGEESIALYTRLPGFLDKPDIILKIEKPRDLYQSGSKTIKVSGAVLGCMMLCFIAVLFYLLEKHILRPIEKISEDVHNVTVSSESINTDAYDDSQELCSLAWAINSMLERLALNQEIALQSTFSLNILQNILNALDTYLFVADLETDTVLFINDKMKSHFQLGDNVIGRPCYEVIKPGLERRCGFCSKHDLLTNPAEPIVSEVKMDITGRNYRKVDMIIDWIDGKKVQLTYFIDITELKQTGAALEKRLRQEKLMSAISQNFINKGDMKAFMDNTLNMTGNFMNISRILLAKYDKKDLSLELKYAWAFGNNEVSVKPGGKMPFEKYKFLYEELVKNNYEPLVFNSTEEGRFISEERNEFEAFFVVPLYVSGEFWGILEFDRCEKIYDWSESDIQFGKLIANVLSGTLTNQSSEDRLLHMSTLVDSAPQYISYINLKGEYEFFNPATCEITGYSYDELMAGGVSILYDDQTKQRIATEIIPQICEMGKYEFDLPLIRKDGEVLIMSFSAFAIGEDRRKHGCIAIDVTEKKRLEKNLMEAKETAEKASRAKSEFLSRMSHEMRTPMNAVIGMTSIAQSAKSIEKKEYCLEKIENASKHLLGVINDILDMSKIEADKFELSYSEFDLEKMLVNTASMVNFHAEEKKQKLIVNLDENIPRFIVGDEQRLCQIITNLLSNAVKFTPDTGTIRLNVKNLGKETDAYVLQFEVVDNGIGISPENQLRLFNPFEQADGSIARQYGGTGLGLAISKRIVELMGGKIWVESQLGQGTKFIFTIKAGKETVQHQQSFISGKDIAAQESFTLTGAGALAGTGPPGTGPPAEKDAKNNFSNYTMLMAEDVEINQEIIAAFLENTGITIDFAENGLKALEMFKKSPERYSLILMDVHMPEMDGYEAARNIRALDFEKAKNIPIIAMTANVFQEDVENCLAAGMNDHIGKPVSIDQVFEKLNKYLPGEKSAKSAAETDKEDRGQLVPDDNSKKDSEDEDGYARYLPALDVEDGLARVMNNKMLYFMLLENFKGGEMADELIQNITGDDFAKIKHTAHALKGTSLNLGLVQLADIAKDIEAQANSKIRAEHLIVPLGEAVDAVVRNINTLLEREGVK